MRQYIARILILLSSIPVLATAEEEPVNPDAENSSAEEAPIASVKNKHYFLPNIPHKRGKSLLEHMRLFDREDEVVSLNTLSESFYGLFLPEESGNPQGGILILHDNQQHGHWPEVIAPIREYLPQFGWATLSIELPDAPARKRIVHEETSFQSSTTPAGSEVAPLEDSESGDKSAPNSLSENSEQDEPLDNAGPAGNSAIIAESKDDDNAEPALPRLEALPVMPESSVTDSVTEEKAQLSEEMIYLQQNQNRILAAIEYLKQRGQFNIVVLGYGIGASWAIDYVQQRDTGEQDQKGLTLITIDALASRHEPEKMNLQLKNLQIPFLDLIHQKQGKPQKMAKKRLSLMKRAKNNRYQQITTASMANYNDPESPTSRRIRGWLMTNAGGTLVKVNP